MKKLLFLPIFMFFLIAALVNAAGIVNITTTSISLSGNPGASVEGSFIIDNEGDATITTITYATSQLAGQAPSFIEANLITGSISGLTVEEEPRIIPLPFTIPTKLAGSYVGTLTATDIALGGTSDEIPFTLFINTIDAIDVTSHSTTASLVITMKEDDQETATLSVKNTGSTAITALALDTTAVDLTDSDGNTITLTLSPLSTATPFNPGDTREVTLTVNTPNGLNRGTYDGIVNVTGTGSLTSLPDTFNLEIRIEPEEVVCEEGVTGDIEIQDVDFDEDEFIPGKTMSVDVRVRNSGDDPLDVVVEVFLYNVNEEEFLDRAETDSIEIDEDDSEDFDNIELTIPTDNIDESDTFILYVKASEDRNEEDHCDVDQDSLDLQLENHEVIIERFSLLPSTAGCGDQISATVDLLNIGKRDESDVYVEIKEPTLELNKRSSTFDLDKFGDRDDDTSVRFSIDLPTDVAEGSYPIEAIVYFDDADRTNSEISTFTLTCGEQPEETAGEITLELLQSEFNIEVGDALSIPVTLTNTEDASVLLRIEATTGKGWDDSDTKTIEIDADESRTVYLDLVAPAKAGSYDVSISVFSGTTTVATDSVSVTVKSKEGAAITGGTTFEPKTVFEDIPDSFWIIGNIVLVVIAVFFLKLIFTRKRG